MAKFKTRVSSSVEEDGGGSLVEVVVAWRDDVEQKDLVDGSTSSRRCRWRANLVHTDMDEEDNHEWTDWIQKLEQAAIMMVHHKQQQQGRHGCCFCWEANAMVGYDNVLSLSRWSDSDVMAWIDPKKEQIIIHLLFGDWKLEIGMDGWRAITITNHKGRPDLNLSHRAIVKSENQSCFDTL